MFSLSDSEASIIRKRETSVPSKRRHIRRCRPTSEVLEGRRLLATGVGGANAAEAGTRTWTPRSSDLQVDQGQTNWLRVANVTTNESVGRASATIDWGDGVTTSGSVAVFAIDYTSPATGDPLGVDVSGEHVYRNSGTYVVRTTIVAEDGDSTTVTDTVVASPPRITSASPLDVVAEPGSLTSPAWVGIFHTVPNLQTDQFRTEVDWGDGTGYVPATVKEMNPGEYGIQSRHSYSRIGTYRVKVVLGQDDTLRLLTAQAVVAAPPLTVSGGLDPTSDTGLSSVDGITSSTQPHFQGSATPNATVHLFATRTDVAIPFPIGQSVADAQGDWSITSLLLGEGTYTITASASTPDGRSVSAVAINAGHGGGPLVIDTTGPRVVGLSLDAPGSRIRTSFLDNLSGLDPRGAVTPTAVIVRRLSGSSATPITLRPLSVSDDGKAVLLGLDRPLRNGRYTLQILAAGVRDLAGNALDGEFAGSFATGNGQPGGDFTARFQVTKRHATLQQTTQAATPQQAGRTSPRIHPHLSGQLASLRTARRAAR